MMLVSLLQRLKVPVVGCALVAGYVWSGAAVKLWAAAHTSPQSQFGESVVRRRSTRGHPRAGANTPFARSLQVYGWLASTPLLGSTTSDFLRGLGNGIDPESADYDARCRAALERVTESGGFNPWRNHARIELAHLLAQPPSFSPRRISWGDEAFEGPAWVTLGLVDAERWWMVHEPAGADPERARELCGAVQQSKAGEFTLGDALRLKADLAAEHWDFTAQESLLRDLVESCPNSPLALQALSNLAARLSMQGRAADAAGLARRLLQRLSPTQRVRIAPQLASLQAMSEGTPAARATLESALREAEAQARDMSERRRSQSDPRGPLLEALKQLPNDPPAAFGPPPSSPGVPVRGRLLAAGKALPGIAVALLPLPQLYSQLLPPKLAAGFVSPRGGGVFHEPEPETQRRRRDLGQAWPVSVLAEALRQSPTLVARTDGKGQLAWPAVPPGVYGVVLRAGTWQLPNAGRDLAVAPLAAPVSVSGPEVTIPDLQLCRAVELEPIDAGERPPGLRWKPVPGAASYRVSLLPNQLRWDNSGGKARCIAAPAVAPEVAWWRDGVKGTSLRLTPEHFTGPAGDTLHSGIYRTVEYRWSVEARDSAGRVIATGESLAPPPAVKLPSWTALRTPPVSDSVKKRYGNRVATGVGVHPAMFHQDQSQFSSPFLDGHLEDEEGSTATTASRPARFPTLDFRGQGLPSRAALAMPGAAPVGGGGPALPGAPGMALMSGPGGMPGRIPPGAMPPGAMPPGAMPPGAMPPGAMPPGAMPPGAMPPGAMPPGFAGMPPVLPSLPRGAVGGPGMPLSPIAGVNPRSAARESARTAAVTLESFDAGSRNRWQGFAAPGDGPTQSRLLIAGPLVLTARETPLSLPAGPGRLTVRLSKIQAEVIAVLLDSRGKPSRLKLLVDPPTRAFTSPVSPGEWKLQSLDIRPTNGEVVLESVVFEAPLTSGLYARAWREGATAWVEITNLGTSAQAVTVEGPDSTGSPVFDLAPGGRARLPLAEAGVTTVKLKYADKQVEVPVRGAEGLGAD